MFGLGTEWKSKRTQKDGWDAATADYAAACGGSAVCDESAFAKRIACSSFVCIGNDQRSGKFSGSAV